MQTVNIAGIDVPVIHSNPGWIPETKLILTPTTRRNLQKILYPLTQGANILLVGDAGVGKNALLYYINQLRKHPTIRYSFNEDTLPEDLVGAYRIDQATHGFTWEDGPLSRSIRMGATFVADEMNLCPPEVLKRFTSVFCENHLQILEGDSSRVEFQKGFNFVATQNPAEGFEGRKNLPREIQKYFVTVYIDSYPQDELVQILSGLHSSIDKTIIEALVRINNAVEKLIIERSIGHRDLERHHFNIRNLNRLLYRAGHNENSLLDEIFDIYFRPFRNPEDREKIKTAVLEICSDEIYRSTVIHHVYSELNHSEDKNIDIHFHTKQGKIDIGRARLISSDSTNEDSQNNSTQSLHSGDSNYINSGGKSLEKRANDAFEIFPPVESARSILESIARSLQFAENILLECDSDVEPEDFVHFFAELLGKNLTVISLSRGMHTSDILGGLKPVKREPGDTSAPVDWVDGPLTNAVRNGDFILLKGLEAAGPELVEKLNMLLDDARALGLPPESGYSEPILLQKAARVFALKYFRKQRSVPSISRAFRNRFTAYVVHTIDDRESLLELASSYLQMQADENSFVEFLDVVVDFHLFIREMAKSRKIGSGNLIPYSYGLTNLKRFCQFLVSNIQNDDLTSEEAIIDIFTKSAGISYVNEISDFEEREKMIHALHRLISKTPLLELIQSFNDKLQKKKLINASVNSKKVWWDQSKHWRKANTGKFKPKLTGRALKDGIEINTPETGGQTKEGPDAWYGSDTQGNMGQGEPGAGGGAWGYRTEALYEEFLKKRRPLWDYQMGVSLEDFRDIFESEIERVVINFDRLLDPQVDISRRYLSSGSRVDVRRYLSYISGRGDGRVFDKTTVNIDDDKLKGVEIIFAVNKGRRIFNFEYAIATLVSIMSCSLILKNHDLSFGVVGYSDLNNKKDNIDLQWFKTLEREFDERAEVDLFNGLANDWHGDTVVESQVLEELADDFSADARTRILVMISDFRGYRARVTIEKDIESFETARLKTVADDLTKRGYILLGVGVGARAISDVLFGESLQVGGENFSNLPALLSSKVTDLIHKHHNAAAL